MEHDRYADVPPERWAELWAAVRPHAVEPEVLGEYAELLHRRPEQAARTFPAVAAHLERGCESCTADLADLQELVTFVEEERIASFRELLATADVALMAVPRPAAEVRAELDALQRERAELVAEIAERRREVDAAGDELEQAQHRYDTVLTRLAQADRAIAELERELRGPEDLFRRADERYKELFPHDDEQDSGPTAGPT